jgi:phosphomannomutase
MLIQSISGIRATIGEGLIPHTLSKYVSAFSNISPEGVILIGRDGRASGEWIESITAATLQACGREVVILGVVPTPTVQFMVEFLQAAGGIVITASHNPDNWNGLKFISSKGIFISADENKKISKLLAEDNIVFSNSKSHPQIQINMQAVKEHIRSIITLPLFNINLIRNITYLHYKVVVDAVNASGSHAIPTLLRAFGCDVSELYCYSSGVFPHDPEPLPENLQALRQSVRHNNADFGIALDPDADRVVLVDEKGEAISEEMTIALAIEAFFELQHIKENTIPKVIVNYSTSKFADYAAKKFNSSIERAPVGEINVVNKMIETGALFGGEGSGGVILPQSHYGRDSLVATSLILSLLTIRGKRLSELVAEYPKLYMDKFKFQFNGNFDELPAKVKAKFPDVKLNFEDGIYFELPNGFIHIRRSNTEPIVRAIIETDSKTMNSKLAKIVSDILQK